MSPSLTNDGTGMTRPVSSVAGLIWSLAVAPLMPGTVVRHHEVDGRRQLDADRLHVVELDADQHFGNEEVLRVAKRFGTDVHLIVGRRVHEVEGVAVAVEELHLPFVERGALDVFFRPELVVRQRQVRMSRILNWMCARLLPGVR